MAMENPFSIIDARLHNIECLLLDMKHKPQQPAVELGSGKTILNIDEFCEYTGLSKQTVYQKTGKGLIPHSKRGKRLYFDKATVDAWLLEHSVRPISEINAEADRRMAGNKKRGRL